MDRFSTQYMPDNEGLARSIPVIRKSLALYDRVLMLSFFALVFCAFLAFGYLNSAMPTIWPGYPTRLTPAIGIVAVVLVGMLILAPLGMKRMGKRFDALLPPTLTRLVVDAEGLTVHDELSHGHWSWPHIRGAVSARGGVVLLLGYAANFIPDAAFKDAAERTAFIELVNRHAHRTGMDQRRGPAILPDSPA